MSDDAAVDEDVDYNRIDGPAEASADSPDDADDDDVAPTAIAVLEYISQQIVTDPDAVDIEIDDKGRDRFELTVTVGPGDTGRVIGRRGRTAQAIRAVVRAAAAKDGVDVDVEFAD